MKLKSLSIILVIVMMLTGLPFSASADVEDPYGQIKAANFDESSTTANKNKGYGLAITPNLSSWVCYKNVNFTDVPYAAVVAIGITDAEGWMDGNKVILRLDSPSAEPFCTIDITEQNGWGTPTENVGTITQKITGVHDVYMSSNKPNDIFYFYFKGMAEGEAVYKPYEATSAFADMADNKYSHEVEAMYGLGIIDEYKEGLFYPNLPILRGEFASWMARFMTETVPAAQSNPFIDIDDCDYINEICYLYDNGILTLNDTKTFNPYDFMTVREASAMLLRLMNYGTMIEYKGGWPNGYDSIAREIGLTTGMAPGDYLRRAPAAKMLYNAIDAEYLEADIKNDNITYSRTAGILGVTRNIYKGTGVVSATSFSGLTGEVIVPDSSCYIGTTMFELGGNVSVDHYLGVKCEYFYYSPDDGETMTLLYIAPVTKTKTLVLDASEVDFSVIEAELIQYTDKNNKEKRIKLDTSVNWIYNHRALGTSIEKVITDPAKFRGNVRLIDNGNGYETVFVENYRNVKVESLNETSNILVDALSGDSWDLSDKTLIISDGTQNIRLNKITRDMLMELYESYDKEVIVLLVGETKITDKVTEITSDGTVIIGNSEYKLANEYVGMPSLGVTMDFYVNRHNEIVYTARVDDTKLVGLLNGWYEDNNQPMISLITSTDTKEDYKVAAKIFIDGYGVKEYDDMETRLLGVSKKSPVLYRINKYGEIFMLDTVAVGTKSSYDTLTLLETGSYFYRDSLGALVQGGTRLVPVKPDAKWIVPRSSGGNGIDWSFRTVGNTIAQYRNYELYSYDPDNKIADLLFSPSEVITNQDTIAVFKEYYYSIDSYDNVGLKAKFVVPGGQEREYFVSNDSTTVFNQVERMQTGDILRLYTDSYGDILQIDFHVLASGLSSNGTDMAKMSGNGGIVESGFDYTYLYGTVKDIVDGYIVLATGTTEQWIKLGTNDVVLLSNGGKLKNAASYTTIKLGDKAYFDIQGASIKMTVIHEQ